MIPHACNNVLGVLKNEIVDKLVRARPIYGFPFSSSAVFPWDLSNFTAAVHSWLHPISSAPLRNLLVQDLESQYTDRGRSGCCVSLDLILKQESVEPNRHAMSARCMASRYISTHLPSIWSIKTIPDTRHTRKADRELISGNRATTKCIADWLGLELRRLWKMLKNASR